MKMSANTAQNMHRNCDKMSPKLKMSPETVWQMQIKKTLQSKMPPKRTRLKKLLQTTGPKAASCQVPTYSQRMSSCRPSYCSSSDAQCCSSRCRSGKEDNEADKG